MPGTLFLIGTPIGNLKDITLRALEILKSVDVVYCEDTRRSIKLLNAYEIKKPLKSCPHFKEKKQIAPILDALAGGQSIAYVSDAGMPGLCDPGEILVAAVREANFKVEIIGGVSSLTHFIAGLGEELESFSFVGFLPARVIDREKVFSQKLAAPMIFFESPHRIQSSLEILRDKYPDIRLILAKELSKISEDFFSGTPTQLLGKIKSFKGEWIGCLFPARLES
ncbi:MAG: 16S rRNA (cytidine(1402)-2'-O)-methyltransferase [Deltaproteobacteria bacterium]|nr:16S rRNA (cytidine(1402)-2'-O)-methyltransferase [Deltaproteobacteria bacterium]